MKICKWYKNAISPVIFMIDDLANVWVDSNNNDSLDIGEDWGFFKRHEKSSITYLENDILEKFENVKTTFFVPVGERVGMIKNSKIKSISRAINFDEKSKEFFRELHNCKKYELAYHGTNHGRVGIKNTDFIQEWALFKDLNEALDKISLGVSIFNDAVGQLPLGGKYCGYISNEFSDESIDESGFIWWCRFCNLDVYDDIKKNSMKINFNGGDKNFITNNDVKYFGKNKVIDIPTTVNGGLLTGIYNLNGNFLKKSIKKIFPNLLIKRKLKLIDKLLQNNLVISIQEHISPARDDGRRQTPNIYDDKLSLIKIFSYLHDKNVWFCTCSELASYVYYRDNLKLTIENDTFEFNIKELKDYKFKNISIKSDKYNKIITPKGKVIKEENGVLNIPIEYGKYKLKKGEL
ncbi:hypothetical protein CPF_0475 [Clostridium perfringens ATCC 13124]|uniref:Uncharacterized protein n=1 Tax=Clostridium perfringens (strain ATCC 13124 / DSM 756 / JCM 1290 / NCIMB 6125 / NCTC 8237 / Type A) TaxID=195103 RepID=A0A0H2YT36_CLOP1|nr:hypothetical protein [Clostridium perfringens]ABG84199.1 hypothetical protein CPF_0475 [Clostridium perfringens ATCC 13124]